MSQTPILIVISPRQVVAARLGRDGRVACSASHPIPGGLKPESWNSGLTELDAPLSSVLSRLGRAAGARARVFYHGPESVSELVRVPTHDSVAAHEATELALADVASFPLSENAGSIAIIQRADALTVALGVADRAPHLDALAGLLSRAGLRADGFCPITAGFIAGLAEQSAKSADAGAALHVHIGENQSTLLTRQRGVIELARGVDSGLAHLVDAMATQLARDRAETSPSTSSGPGGDSTQTAPVPRPDELRDAARATLLEKGLSSGSRRQGTMDRASMVAIQPVLQRMVVEIRQTVRFGFGDVARQGARIVIHGPVTRVPGLAEYLTEALSDEVVLAPSGAGEGDLDIACLLASAKAPSLLPPELSTRRAARRVQCLAACGTVLALGLVAFEYLAVSKTLASEQSRATDASTRLIEARERRALMAAGRAEETRVAQTLASLRSALGNTAQIAPALQVVSDGAPEQLRLADVRLADAAAGQLLTLDGVILGGSERAAADVLRAYVRHLESSPSFASVRLGATRTVRVDGHPAQKFSIEATLTSVPVFALEETQ